MPEPIFMKLGMYIMALEPLSMTYFINFSHQSVCLYVYVARQRFGKNVTTEKIQDNNRRIVGRVVFYAVRVVSKESLIVYHLILARQRLGKHVPAATRNCWSRRFLCGIRRIKEN
jgi:hypothetical protein